MTDISTLARLSEPTLDGTDGGPPVVTAEEAPRPAASRKPRIAIGAVARRGVRIFALVAIAFLVFAFWLSGLSHARSQVGLQRRFRAELASNSADVGGAIPSGAPVAIVRIPSIGLNEVVVEGSRSGELRKGPGHVAGTPLPGQPGNAVLAGRKTLYGGPFGRLGSLHKGDRILVTTGEGTSTYRVGKIHHLGVDNGSFVQNVGDNRLTLFTSDSAWTPSGRLAVSALLMGKPFPPTTPRDGLDPDGLGLTGERGAVPYMLVWLELLAAAGLLAAYFASRWSAARVWLVFTPVLALGLWLFFESAVRLLPATL